MRPPPLAGVQAATGLPGSVYLCHEVRVRGGTSCGGFRLLATGLPPWLSVHHPVSRGEGVGSSAPLDAWCGLMHMHMHMRMCICAYGLSASLLLMLGVAVPSASFMAAVSHLSQKVRHQGECNPKRLVHGCREPRKYEGKYICH